VDKFRVIALRASPASGSPGEEIVLEALMSETPSGGAAMTIWAACFPLPGQSGRQCLESLADEASVEERLEFLGIGFEPTTSFVLPPLAEGQEQTEVFIIFSACTTMFVIPDCECPGPGCGDCVGGLDMSEFCDGDYALVFKSVKAVADLATANQNPGIERVLIGGDEWPQEEEPGIPCDPQGDCDPVELAVEPTPGSAQTYVDIRFDEEVEFTEEPYVSWFATAGSMGKERSSVDEETGLAEVRWTPPGDETATVTFYFVMYDGRGGLDFTTRNARIEAPGP
jgi:hypothetical protein